MMPGRSVASPRSITVAPAGTARPLPAALMVPPSMTTTPFATVVSRVPSNRRAAFRTVTVGGSCATADDAAMRIEAASTRAFSTMDLQ